MACFEGFVRGHAGLAVLLGTVAVVIGLPGLVQPWLIRPIYVGATLLTFPIGWVVSKLILAGLFYGVFTPVSLIFWLMGRDVLSRRTRPATVTYWQPKHLPTDPRRYFRPF